jgi:hypothetical protein
MHARLVADVLRAVPRQPRQRIHIGAAPLENAQRAAYQSARCRDGHVAPLPLTLAEAWAEADRMNPQGDMK